MGKNQRAHFKGFNNSVFYFLAGIIPTSIAWIINFRELPLTSGFITFPLQDSALIPYRDYFFPVTPLTYFEAHITANAKFGLHNFIALTLLTVPIFGLACFSLARRFLGNIGSLFLVIISITTMLSLRLEQIGGWNTQSYMLMTIGFVFFINAVLRQIEHSSENFVKDIKMMSSALLSGLFFSLAIMAKQTCAITLVVVVVLMAVWIYWEKDSGFVRSVSYPGFLSLVGTLPVFLFTLYFLISNHALTPFLQDMLSGGGKNPNFVAFPLVLYESIVAILPVKVLVSLSCFVVVFYTWRRFHARFFTIQRGVLFSRIQYFSVLFVCSYALWRFSSIFNPALTVHFLLWNAIVSLCIVLFSLSPLPAKAQGLIATLVILFFIMGMNWKIGGSLYSFMSRIGTPSSIQIAFIVLAVVISSILVIPRKLQILTAAKISKYLGESPLTFAELKFVIIFANVFFFATLVNLYSSGVGLFIEWFIPQMIIYFSFLVLLFRKIGRRFPLHEFVVVWLVLVAASTLVFTFNSPYSWFNWIEVGTFTPHTSSDFPGDFGFQLSGPAYSYYSRIYSDGLRAATLSGKGKSATVFTFPSIPTTASVTGLRNYTAIKCVILFFDICPNAQAAADLVSFEKSPPNVVIWQPTSEGFVQFNELTFLRARSALRDWEAYRLVEIAAGKWKLVDTITSPVTNGWTTYVYAVLG